MSYEFGNPAPPRSFKAVEYLGDVVIVIKGGVHEAIKTQDFGVKPATRVTVIMLTGRDAGEVFEDVLLWSKQHETFRDEPQGKAIVCRIMAAGRGASFDVVSDYDRKQATAWVEDNRPLFDKLLAETVGNFRDKDREMAESTRRSDSTPTGRQYAPSSTEEEPGY